MTPTVPDAQSRSSRMTLFSFAGAVTISAASSAPTPLYHLYQQEFHLSAAMITMIFGAYAFALLAALLTFGALSDYLGRKPLILLALLLNAAALVIFLAATSGETLILARIVQGFSTGIAFPTFGATILDTDRNRGPMLNSITAFLGLTIGSLSAGILVSYAPLPLHLVYVVLLVVTFAEILALAAMPETVSRQPGALKAMRPRLAVPRHALATLIRVTPVNIASWALGGFYLSLMPSLVSVAIGIASPFVGAAVVSTLMLSATISAIVSRKVAPRLAVSRGSIILVAGVLVTLVGIHANMVAALFAGTAIAGLGFGSIFGSILRLLLPMAAAHERASLFSAFLVESYLAFAIPAILAGMAAPVIGLSATAIVYGGAVVILTLISLAAMRTGLTDASPVAR
jgi:predicted MFS family arabinose efflux permease